MTGRRWRRGSLASLTFAVTVLALVGAGGGCEIAIGSAIPEFECESNKAAVCPGDQVCDPNQHLCVEPCSVTNCKAGFTCDPGSNICIVAASDDGPVVDEPTTGDEPDADASTQPDEAAPPVDTGMPETVGPCKSTGCACTGSASCDSQICGDSSLVPQAILTMATFAFCTKPCCTSADCDAGTVCFATGGSSSVAANFCVEPQWIGRQATVGAGVGGASCSTGRDCRSGLCTSNHCSDVCCSTATSGECGSGTSCRFASFPGATSVDQNFVAWCGQAGNGQNGDTCNNDSSCASNLCDGIDGCANACRNTGDCSNGESCAYVNPPAPNDTAVVAACFSGAGNTPMGSSCSSDTDCRSQFCDTGGTHECTDVCFTNADCSAKSGWRCRPESVTLQSGGKVEVLACGP